MHKGSLFSTSWPTLVVSCPFDDGHSDRCEAISHCGFDLISPMISDVEHLLMCLLAICMSALEKYPFSYSYFLIRFFYFLLLSCMSFLYILDINPLSDIWFANIFSHSVVSCLFIFLMVSSAVKNLLSLIQSHLSIFAFVIFAFGVKSKKSSPRPMLRSLQLMLSSRTFTVSGREVFDPFWVNSCV